MTTEPVNPFDFHCKNPSTPAGISAPVRDETRGRSGFFIKRLTVRQPGKTGPTLRPSQEEILRKTQLKQTKK